MEILEIIQTVVAVLKIIETAIQVLGPVIQKIGQELGLISQDATCEDLGARAFNAEEAGIVPENFASFEAYLAEIKKFPPETSKPLEETLKKGSELILGLIAEKFPELELGVFEKFAELPELVTEQWASDVGKLLKLGVVTTSAISDFFLGKPMADTDRYNVINALLEIEKKNNPEISDSEAMEKITKVRN